MDQTIAFLSGMFGSRAIEITAAACGFLNVWLIIRRSIWNYPFGFAMVTIYAFVFYEYRLYSDALLQVYFFVVQIFGVWWWLNYRDSNGQVTVRALSGRAMAFYAVGGGVAAAALGFVMAGWTDAALPYPDALTTVLSVIAQFLLARRYVQSWLVWIAVDVLAIAIYLSKGLYPTATLYLVFLVLAVIGLRAWRAAHRTGGVIAA